MNSDRQRSNDFFEEIASSFEHEYMCNSRLNTAPGDHQKQYLYLLRSLASFCRLSWEDMNVDYRASHLSKWPPYHTMEEMLAKIAALDDVKE
jgi:hypothetical protein